jgi:hypothetical protein
MGRRRDPPRAARDHQFLRLQALGLRHRRQPAHQTPGRLADAAPMPLARPLRTAAPESKRVAIQPVRRDMRGVDQRLALFEAAPFEKVRLVRRLVMRCGHDCFLRQRPTLSPRAGRGWGAAASERRGSAPATRFLGRGRARDPDGSKDRALRNAFTRHQRALPAPSCPSPAGCPADRSSCRPGVSTRSRPGTEYKPEKSDKYLPNHKNS